METKKEFEDACLTIDNFQNKLGEFFYDMIQSDDNEIYDMGKDIIHVIKTCKTKEEFNAANEMLKAVCGYGLSSIIDEIIGRDAEGYDWTWI